MECLVTSLLKRSVPVELELRGATAGGCNDWRCVIRSPIVAAGVSQIRHRSCSLEQIKNHRGRRNAGSGTDERSVASEE